MKTLEDSRLSILTSLARKQKISNLILLLVLIVTLWLIQTKIDSQEGFILQGLGASVYWITGTLSLLLWSGLSSTNKPKNDKTIALLHNGELDTHGDDRDCIRLLRAYANVTERLGLKPENYNLMILLEKTKNAFATGLNRGKTICVHLGAIQTSSPEELESLIAHEFGHTVNKDLAFTVIKSGLSFIINILSGTLGLIIFLVIIFTYNKLQSITTPKSGHTAKKDLDVTKIPSWLVHLVNLLSGIIGSAIVWVVLDLWSAIIFLALSIIIIPLVSNYASRVTEKFADSYATLHGYGPGLQSFLKKVDHKISFFGNHPHPQIRIKYIQKIIDGDEGVIPEKLERNTWFYAKAILIVLAAIYLIYFQSLPVDSTILFLMAGGFFLAADTLLNSNAGSWQASLNLNKLRKSKNVDGSQRLSALIQLLVYVGLFICGIVASYLFIHSPIPYLALLAKICLVLWTAKPIIALLGFVSDLFSTLSDLTTYLAFITSLLMMASYFTTLLVMLSSYLLALL